MSGEIIEGNSNQEDTNKNKFVISDKTTNADLKALIAGGAGSYDFKGKVAEDMWKNVQELVAHRGFSEAQLDVIGRGVKPGGRVADTPYHALYGSIAQTIGASIVGCGWGMSSPEAVYMTGFVVARSLSRDRDALRARMEDTTRKFESPEQETAKREEEAKIFPFADYLANCVNGDLKAYAEASQLSEEKRDVLEQLAFVHLRKQKENVASRQRKQVYEAIQKDDYATAREILK